MTLLYDFKGVWAELEVFAYCGFCATKWLNIAACIHPMEVFTECKFISQWKKKIGDSSWHPRDRGCPFNMGSAWYRFHCKTIIIVLLAIAFVAGIKWGGGGKQRVGRERLESGSGHTKMWSKQTVGNENIFNIDIWFTYLQFKVQSSVWYNYQVTTFET